jgi:hypothetical protein
MSVRFSVDIEYGNHSWLRASCYDNSVSRQKLFFITTANHLDIGWAGYLGQSIQPRLDIISAADNKLLEAKYHMLQYFVLCSLSP